MFSQDGKCLACVQKNRPAWQDGLFNGIGGKIEPGEEALDAMIREFKEETGVTFRDWLPFVHLAAERDRDTGEEQSYEIFFYKAFTDKVFDCITMTDEKILVNFVSEIPYRPTEYVRNLKWLVPMALDPYVNGPGGGFIELRDLGGN